MPYQVFISFKRNRLDGTGFTRDYEMAADLHRTLLANGINTFFSEKDLSTSSFRDEIDEALDEAQILIAVGTSKENLDSQNVKYEWRSFYDDLLGGYKPNGQIYTYLEGMSQSELPRALRQRQSFTSDQTDMLVVWVRNNLGIKDEVKQEEQPVMVEEVPPESKPEPLPIHVSESDDIMAPVDESESEPTLKPKLIGKDVEKPNTEKPNITEKTPKTKSRRKWVIGAVAAVLSVAMVAGIVFNAVALKSLNNIKSIRQLSVGQHVKFGTYEQDANTSNGKEPIEWRVLAIEDNKALLLSEYILDCRIYSNTYSGSWETSRVRAWENGDFLDRAFDSDEQDKIAVTKIAAGEGYTDARDKLFLLSSDELLQYFENTNEDRIAVLTPYAKTHTHSFISDNNAGYWWLRGDLGNVAYVLSNGQINYSSTNFVNNRIGVRPAMWVKIP